MGKLKWFVWAGIPVVAFVALYVFSAMRYASLCTVSRASCLEHRKAGCTFDGVYNLRVGDLDTEAVCDMKTAGGGWTLVANYLHRRHPGNEPAVVMRTRFPLVQGDSVGSASEVGTASWGHVSNRILQQLSFREMRFRCQTTAHPRLVDFIMTDSRCLDYFRTGKGYCVQSAEDGAALGATTTKLPGSQSELPEIASKGWHDQGDFAMVNYPFLQDWKHHWSVGAADSRYECDDYEHGATVDTWHQIWVR